MSPDPVRFGCLRRDVDSAETMSMSERVRLPDTAMRSSDAAGFLGAVKVTFEDAGRMDDAMAAAVLGILLRTGEIGVVMHIGPGVPARGPFTFAPAGRTGMALLSVPVIPLPFACFAMPKRASLRRRASLWYGPRIMQPEPVSDVPVPFARDSPLIVRAVASATPGVFVEAAMPPRSTRCTLATVSPGLHRET